MLLDQFKKNRDAIREIGRDAAEKGRPLGLDPSWSDDDPQSGHAAKAVPQVSPNDAGSRDAGHDLQSERVTARRKI